MHKNRRKHHRSPSSKLSLQSKTKLQKPIFSFEDKQNEAKLALLDLGNDDTMLHIDAVLGIFNTNSADQNPSRNSLIDQMKVHETQILGRLSRKTKKKIYSANEIHPLHPIDSNTNFQYDNFVEDKPRLTSSKKKLFSLRNTFYHKSKQNIVTLRKELETRKQEKTILKLKKILKKLESPQKTRAPSNHIEAQIPKQTQEEIRRKKNLTKITEFCNEFLHRNKCASKQRTVFDFGSHQKPTQSPNENTTADTTKIFQLRSGCKTSHEKYRACVTPIPISSSPAPFFYKPTKLTNKSILFKRQEVSTAEVIHQKNFCSSIKKTSTRMAHQASRSNIDQMFSEDMFMHNEKKREERKHRNLKNILFD